MGSLRRLLHHGTGMARLVRGVPDREVVLLIFLMNGMFRLYGSESAFSQNIGVGYPALPNIAGLVEQIDVTVNVQILDFATELDMIYKGEHDAFIMGFVPAGDDGDFLHDSLYTSGDYTQNTAAYSSARYDELMDTARVSQDPAVRQDCYAQVQDLLNEELPWIPLANATYDYGMRATLTGLDPDIQGTVYLGAIRPKETV